MGGKNKIHKGGDEKQQILLVWPCKHVGDCIAAVFDVISNPLGDDAVCLLQQYENSSRIYDIEDTSDLSNPLAKVEKGTQGSIFLIKKYLIT